MRTTTKSLMIAALIAVAATRNASAQAAPITTTHNVSVVVPTLVRVVAVEGSNGTPEVRVISNDPRLRAMSTVQTRPDLIPGTLAYQPAAGHSFGGAKSMGGTVTTDAPVTTYTIAVP